MTITIRPPTMRRPDHAMEMAATLAKGQQPLIGRPSRMEVVFSLTGDSGIVIDCCIDVGQQRVILQLFQYPDPFSQQGTERESNDVYCTAFDTWLRAIERGDYPAIAFDTEGSAEALAVIRNPDAGDRLTLVYCEDTYFVARMVVERGELLRAFREGLGSFMTKHADPWASATKAMMERPE